MISKYTKKYISRLVSKKLLGVLALVFVLLTVGSIIFYLSAKETKAYTTEGSGVNLKYTLSTEEGRYAANFKPSLPPEPGYKWVLDMDSHGTFIVEYSWIQVKLNPGEVAPTTPSATPTSAESRAAEQRSASICGTFDFYCQLKLFVIGLGDAILWFFSWFTWLGGKLLDLALWFTKEQGFTKSQVVQIGWPIVRDLANMFFALILLVIAFATILRLESYGMKAILWRLVVAALLINFSLVIAGVVIDGSNVLTRYFLNYAGGGKEWGISENLMNSLRVADIYNTTGQISQSSAALKGLSDISMWALVLNILFGIIIMLITAFVLFAAACLFYVRLVVLWILLIFAPLAWLAMILPATRNLWNKWWQEFGKWIIFAPVYAFFLYLTLAMMRPGFLFNSLSSVQAGKAPSDFSSISSSFNTAGNWSVNAFAQSATLISNYIVIIIFLVAGLIFARSSGIHGASAMVNLGKSWRQAGMRTLSRWQAGGAKIPGTGWISQKTGLTDWINRQRTTGKGLGYLAATALRAPGATKRFIASKTNRQVLRDAWAEIGRRADEKAFTTPAASVVGMWENIKGAFKGGAELVVDKTDAKGRKIQIGSDLLTGAPIYEQETIKTSRLQAFKNIFSDENVYVEKAKQTLINKRMQDFSNIKDEETLVHYFNQATDPQDKEALWRLIASINGLNTLFRSMGRAFDPQEIKKYIQEAFRPENALRIAADTQSIGYANGNMDMAA